MRDAEGWDDFIARCWRREPTVLKQPFADPLPSASAAFDALVAASDQFRERSDFPKMRINVDGGFLMVDMDERLPTAADGDFDRYAERLRSWLAGRPFLITLNDYQSWDPEFWVGARRFLRALYDRAGLPAGPMLANLWMGLYEYTPFGIHTDHAETFLYLVHGVKRMLVWPHEVFAGRRVYHTPGGDHLGTTDYRRHLDTATILEAEPGDLIYWPASYWHMAESNGSATVSLNWAYLTKERPRIEPLKAAMEPLQAMAIAELGAALDIEDYPPPKRATDVPEVVEAAAAAVVRAAADPSYRRQVTAHWLAHVTGFALGEPPPPRRGVALDERDRVAADPDAPVLLRDDVEPWILAAAGKTVDLPDDPRIRALVDRLNSGRAMLVGALEAPFAGGDGPMTLIDVRLLLEDLVRFRGLDVVP